MNRACGWLGNSRIFLPRFQKKAECQKRQAGLMALGSNVGTGI